MRRRQTLQAGRARGCLKFTAGEQVMTRLAKAQRHKHTYKPTWPRIYSALCVQLGQCNLTQDTAIYQATVAHGCGSISGQVAGIQHHHLKKHSTKHRSQAPQVHDWGGGVSFPSEKLDARNPKGFYFLKGSSLCPPLKTYFQEQWRPV